MKKKQLIQVTLLITLVVCQSSCGLFSRNLAKRYRNSSGSIYRADPTNTAKNFVEVSLSSSLVQPGENPNVVYNILSLSPQGQEQLIKSIEAKSADLAKLITQVTTNFSFNKGEKPNIKIIGTKVSKSLVFTVDRKVSTYDAANQTYTFNNKADRIDFLELKVELLGGSKAAFNSWDKFTTKFATLNLGSVTQSQDFSASLNLNANATTQATLTNSKATEDFNSSTQTNVVSLAGPSGTNTATNSATDQLLTTGKVGGTGVTTTQATAGLGGNGNLTYSDKYSTSLDLRSRIVDISGSLSDNKIILRQESGPGQDLSGNQTVLLDYLLKDDWKVARFTKFTNLYTAAATPTAIASLNNAYLTVIFPNLTADVTGTLSYQFLYRQVNHGNRHIPEARHKVTYRYGEVGITNAGVPVTLIKTEDVRPKSYDIWDPGSNSALLINNQKIPFETALDAESFLHYLGALLTTGGATANVTINGNTLTAAAYSNLTIKTIQL